MQKLKANSNNGSWIVISAVLTLALFAPVGWAAFPADPLNIGTLKPGQSASVEFEVVINNPLPSGITSVTNIKAVTANGGIISASSQVTTATGPTAPVPEPDMIVYLLYGLAGLWLVSVLRRRSKTRR